VAKPWDGAVVKRSVSIRGHRTSFSLETPFFDRLQALARVRSISMAALIAEIDEARPHHANLSSALRVHVLNEACANAVDLNRDRRP
jgi:predicted DNA-binding ribbon-helix-helix protein